MGIPEAARVLGVAPADLREVTRHPKGYEVTAWTGARWLISDVDGRLYALDRHPQTKNLELYEEPAEPADDEEPADEEPVEERDLAVDVPQGNVGEVIDWVGEDRDRAVVALNAERESAKPRKGLVNHLEQLIGG